MPATVGGRATASNREHGDYATNVALQLAKKAGIPPRELATLLAERLRGRRRDRGRRDRRPGLPQHHASTPARRGPVARAGRRGRCGVRRAATLFAGEKVNLEFVSANPTGPIHLGGTRWAAVGDALGRIFDAAGAEVTGSTTSTTTAPRSTGSPVAAGQRHGRGRRPRTATAAQYIADIAAAGRRRSDPTSLDLPDDEAQEVFRDASASNMMFDEIKATLHDFGVDFDVYFHENNLHESGAVERAIERLTEHGQHLRAGRRAVAAHRRSSATTRTG